MFDDEGHEGEQPAVQRIRAVADDLDLAVDRLTGHLVDMADDRTEVVDLSGRWTAVAAKLDAYSPDLAAQARQLSETLAQLDQALARMSEPVGSFIGSAGRAADTLRLIAD